jgi:hypothetical protein
MVNREASQGPLKVSFYNFGYRKHIGNMHYGPSHHINLPSHNKNKKNNPSLIDLQLEISLPSKNGRKQANIDNRGRLA